MNNILFNDLRILKWIISALLSIVGIMGSFVLWYIISIFKKVESNGEQIKRNNQKITDLREHINGHVSKILTNEKDVSEELFKIRRSLDCTTMVIERRKSEIGEIVAEGKRAVNRMEKMESRIEEQQSILKTHHSELIKLKGGNILVKGNKKQ